MISLKVMIIHYVTIWFMYMIWIMFWVLGVFDDFENVEWFLLGVPVGLGINGILFIIHCAQLGL